tara:strand:+ start:720 stop:965 length:246 start_codon:yes stop_codon:yes gene_type:complete
MPTSDLQQNKDLIGQYTVEGDEIVARFKIDPKEAKSGKSMLLASTRGAELFTHKGMGIRMNINMYVPVEEYKAATKSAKKS